MGAVRSAGLVLWLLHRNVTGIIGYENEFICSLGN
ncbi:hypothetical protein SacN8_03540 [Sulfolobus acidocaldarius N8]|uniref:Uncharacterized protein n=2 Tax=Sulfolobus acidocaldarius TaxID=2285 RepID=M1IAY9_9CREN|nr:hypothetical protein SacN8_03540 [Sulfolobus acidocaldarius N8]AGE72953.1 hypothetical protein SacRon12I_03525 [Sulfolobus acidocaldarius Ron12/I]